MNRERGEALREVSIELRLLSQTLQEDACRLREVTGHTRAAALRLLERSLGERKTRQQAVPRLSTACPQPPVEKS